MVRRLVFAALALTMIATACGDDAAESAATTSAPPTTVSANEYPLEVRGATIPARPERIVSASATHTEILYAIDAGDEVIATDLFSDYPPAAAATEKIDSFNLNIEAIAGFDPDLVVLAYDPGEAVEGFAALGIPVILFNTPSSLEGAYTQIEELGAATGNRDQAAALVAGMKEEIAAIVADVEPVDAAPTFFHEVDNTLYSVTSATFIGSLYSLLGLENIADPADVDGFGYPQLTAEYILDADPDFIFMADVAFGESAASVASRPGWETLSAVSNGRVIELDADIASRWGPRVVDFLISLKQHLTLVGSQ